MVRIYKLGSYSCFFNASKRIELETQSDPQEKRKSKHVSNLYHNQQLQFTYLGLLPRDSAGNVRRWTQIVLMSRHALEMYEIKSDKKFDFASGPRSSATRNGGVGGERRTWVWPISRNPDDWTRAVTTEILHESICQRQVRAQRFDTSNRTTSNKRENISIRLTDLNL